MYAQQNTEFIKELNISPINTCGWYQMDKMLHDSEENWETQRLIILLWITMSRSVLTIAQTIKKEQVLEAYYLLKNKNLTKPALYTLFITFKDNKEFCKEILMHPLILETPDLLELVFATVDLCKERQIASNCNIPSNFLSKLDYRDFHMANVLIHNPNITNDLKESIYYAHKEKMPFLRNSFLNDKNWELRKLAIQSLDTISCILSIASSDEKNEIREIVANHSNTPPKELKKLAFDNNIEIKIAVASNFNTPIETLNFLASQKDVRILVSLARNRAVTTITLENILKTFTNLKPDFSKDNYSDKKNSFDLVEALMKNPNISQKIICKILVLINNKKNYSRRLQFFLERNVLCNTKHVIDFENFKYIIQNFSDIINKNEVFKDILALKHTDSLIIEYIYLEVQNGNEKGGYRILSYIASHDNTPEHILQELIQDQRITILKGLAKNKCLPENLMLTLKQKNNHELNHILDIRLASVDPLPEINLNNKTINKEELLIESFLEGEQYDKIQLLFENHVFFKRFDIIRLNNKFSWYLNQKAVSQCITYEKIYDFSNYANISLVAKTFLATEEKHGNPKNEETCSVLRNLAKKPDSLATLIELLELKIQFPIKEEKKPLGLSKILENAKKVYSKNIPDTIKDKQYSLNNEDM